MRSKIPSRSMADNYTRPRSKGAKPSRVSFIVGGVKYKPGVAPARVCPAPRARPRGTMARMVSRPIFRQTPVLQAAEAAGRRGIDGKTLVNTAADAAKVKDAPAVKADSAPAPHESPFSLKTKGET